MLIFSVLNFKSKLLRNKSEFFKYFSMSINCLEIKTNVVLWRNIQLPHPNKYRQSPRFCLNGFDYFFENSCYWSIRELGDYYHSDVHEEKWTFALRGEKCSDFVVIPYVEAEGKFVRITSTIKDTYIWRSDFEAIVKPERDTITMLFLFSQRSVTLNTELNIDQTSLSISKDLGKESIQTLCLKGLSEDIGKLFNDAESSDATLKCADKSFSVHRRILAARSEVFSAMFQHDLSEKNTGLVDIVDLDSNILEQFLRYLYTGNIELMSMDVALELYQAAEKYSVPTLKQLCVSYILDNMSKDIVFEVLILADKAGDMELIDGVASFAVKIEGFLKSTEWEEFAEKCSNVAVKVYSKYFK